MPAIMQFISRFEAESQLNDISPPPVSLRRANRLLITRKCFWEATFRHQVPATSLRQVRTATSARTRPWAIARRPRCMAWPPGAARRPEDDPPRQSSSIFVDVWRNQLEDQTEPH